MKWMREEVIWINIFFLVEFIFLFFCLVSYVIFKWIYIVFFWSFVEIGSVMVFFYVCLEF